MNRNKYIVLILVSLIIGCTVDQQVDDIQSELFPDLFLEMMEIEHAIYLSELNQAQLHLKHIEVMLGQECELFCTDQELALGFVHDEAKALSADLNRHGQENLLEKLRLIKQNILDLETEIVYDPYVVFIWRFEEAMNQVTNVALDPLLGLYEWPEFLDMVEDMNLEWSSMALHSPSNAFFLNNKSKFKNQLVEKSNLSMAIESFNIAVESDQSFDLCDTADNLLQAYIEYIGSFVMATKIKDDGSLAVK